MPGSIGIDFFVSFESDLSVNIGAAMSGNLQVSSEIRDTPSRKLCAYIGKVFLVSLQEVSDCGFAKCEFARHNSV